MLLGEVVDTVSFILSGMFLLVTTVTLGFDLGTRLSMYILRNAAILLPVD